MQVRINIDGQLIITPESEVEAYALNMWKAQEIEDGSGRNPNVVIEPFTVPLMQLGDTTTIGTIKCTCPDNTTPGCPMHPQIPIPTTAGSVAQGSDISSDINPPSDEDLEREAWVENLRQDWAPVADPDDEFHGCVDLEKWEDFNKR